MEKEVQKEKLQKLVEENKAVKTVMETLSKRQRYRTKTDLYQFRDQVKRFTGTDLEKEELLNSFKELQDAGVGKLIYKRKRDGSSNNRPRFEWRYSLKDVARASGFGEPLSTPIGEIHKKRPETPQKRGRGRPPKEQAQRADSPIKRSVKSVKAIISTIQLRPNFSVRIEYPTKMTKDEAKKIANFLISTAS